MMGREYQKKKKIAVIEPRWTEKCLQSPPAVAARGWLDSGGLGDNPTSLATLSASPSTRGSSQTPPYHLGEKCSYRALTKTLWDMGTEGGIWNGIFSPTV